jgi:tight adherence protein B
MNVWLPAALVFVAAVFGTLSLALLWEALRDAFRRARTRRRLDEVVGHALATHEADLIRAQDSDSGFLESLARVFPGLEGLRMLLVQARIELGVDSFLALCVASAAGAAGAAWLLGAPLLLAALAGSLGAALPYLWASRRRKKRLRAFEEQMPEAIDLLTRAIRAGHPISSGMHMVADEAPPVVAEEFLQTFEQQRFGLPFEDALMNLVERVDSVDVRIFATALLIQRDVGGNLAEILDNLADTIRKRFYIRRQLRVYTAQGRLTGWVLAMLPIVVGGIIHLLNDQYLSVLFENTGGLMILGSAIMLQIMGVLWIRAIINIDI